MTCDKEAGKKLNKSSLSDLLKGKFVKAPPWERVAAYAIACVQAAEAKGIRLRKEDVLRQLRNDHATLTQMLETSTRKSASHTPRSRTVTGQPERRLFGSVPVLAGAFQRRAVSDRLTHAVEDGGTVVITGASPTSLLIGLGGVGKTQVAADHAHRRWDTEDVDLLVWIPARSRDAILASYIEVAVETLGQAPDKPERAWRRLLEWLAETSRRWLIVLDDLQHPDHLSGLWPPHSATGQVIVTTRRRDAALHGHRRQIVDVNLFTIDEASAYLLEKLPDRARTEEEQQDLAALAKDLEYLPLALAQAAAYLSNKPLLSTTGYLDQVGKHRTALREVFPKEQELPDGHEQTVAATWAVSIDEADQLDPASVARPILELASLLDPAGIPAAIFTTEAVTQYLSNRLGQGVTVSDTEGGLECLSRFSLLTLDFNEPHRVVRVHALVQRAVRDTVSDGSLGDLARTTADAFVGVWPVIETDRELVQALRANTVVLHGIAEQHLWKPAGHPLLFRNEGSLGQAGLLNSAIIAGTRLHEEAHKHLGPDHPDTLMARSNLASRRGEAGDPTGTATAYEELLTDYLRVLGPDHPSTLTARNNLAHWRGEAGDATGAADAYQELLADRLRVLGPDDPSTLTTRSNLASWQGHTGDAAGAAAATEELLPDYLRVLGPDHPDTLATRSNLASWQGRGGDAAGAAAAYEELLPDYLRVLGPDHPDTLTTRNNLAYWRGEAGDATGAAAATEELLADRLRVLGPDHADTLTTRSNLASLQGEAGDATGAAAATEELLADRLRVLGPDHPDTLTTRNNLASWQGHTGDATGAADAYQELLTDYLRLLGPDHPSTLTTRNNLAHWRGEVGDATGAADAYQELLADRLRVLGPGHPDTLTTRNNLAYWRGVLGRP
ncbi:tetratricopeptide repeat protein [Amycolatopsis sp. TRM77291]